MEVTSPQTRHQKQHKNSRLSNARKLQTRNYFLKHLKLFFFRKKILVTEFINSSDKLEKYLHTICKFSILNKFCQNRDDTSKITQLVVSFSFTFQSLFYAIKIRKIAFLNICFLVSGEPRLSHDAACIDSPLKGLLFVDTWDNRRSPKVLIPINQLNVFMSLALSFELSSNYLITMTIARPSCVIEWHLKLSVYYVFLQHFPSKI